ncbi:RHS repeat-associated core domain-containing protein, partial [Victivallis sp. Marseille-Q1083]|uniref:RHS repeat-associated core domain-containing protein n=1 Tax=Victivallis sp. Marseille-Q1083 TaxID=2717288 RepID=UPI00158B14DF
YLWGEDLSGSLQGAGGVGGLLAEKRGGQTYLPVYDGNGNIMSYLNASTKVSVAEYIYDAFGRTISSNGAEADNFTYRFSTKPVDGNGLYYYGYRYYDPQHGRWISRDPIEENGGVNLYGFVGNNAISYIDVSGLYSIDFHYYTIYYLLRAKCWSPEEANIVAGWSQYLDVSSKTDAVARSKRRDYETSAKYHFPGSTEYSATVRDDPATRDEVIKAFRAYEEGGFGVTVRLGACLHTYADSWGHEGFTAWWNSSINRRTGSMRPNIGHADAADGGSAP